MLIMTSRAAETAQPPASATSTNNDTAVASPVTSPILSAQQQKDQSGSSKPEPQSVLARRQFPAVVFIVMYSSTDAAPSIRGVFMSLSNANQECRRLQREHAGFLSGSTKETSAEEAARVEAERKRDIGRELERWSDPEGVECWVEVHGVVPRKWMGRESVSSVTHPPAPKLYQNEDDDDEIVDDEEYQGFS